MASEIKIYGPYPHHGAYRCQLAVDGRRSWLPAADTAERAERIAHNLVQKMTEQHQLTIEGALDRYREHLTAKENKPQSIATTFYRLRRFFTDAGLAVAALTSRRCAGYYAALTAKQRADTHRNTLAEARTFCRWLVKQRLLRASPLDEVEAVGRRRHGKPQLRLDEARCWLRKAEELAEQGNAGAVAAMVALLMGLRSGEIIARTVRDLDDGGHRLWIPTSKTEAGKRTVKVPDCLQPHLLRLARDKLPTAYLFPGKGGGLKDRAWPRKWVKRLCQLANVPEVCAHSMRGLHATLAIEAGASPDMVAASLGHESASVTLSSYASPGSAGVATAQRAISALLPAFGNRESSPTVPQAILEPRNEKSRQLSPTGF